MKKLLLLLLLSLPVSASETYVVAGYEHISSVFVGKPFNDKPETSVDFVYVGVRHERGNWSFQADVAHLIQKEDFYGNNPRAIFRVEKKLWKSK